MVVGSFAQPFVCVVVGRGCRNAYVSVFSSYLRCPHQVPGSWSKGSALTLLIVRSHPATELAIRSLIERSPLASSLAQLFKANGFTLALVGGPVRDAILGRLGNDLDFTTNARPLATKKILQQWAESVWDTGIAFGTVAGKRGDTTVEVTTYRTESYDPESRKPEVEYGD